MAYNMIPLEAAESFPEIAVASNDLSGGLFSVIVLLLIGTIIFIYFHDKKIAVVLTGDSFILMVLSIGMFFVNLTTWQVLVTTIVMFIASIIFLVASKD